LEFVDSGGGYDMRNVFAVLITVSCICSQDVRAGVDKLPQEDPEFVKVAKGGRYDVITITGRIRSRHVRFRRGRSVRSYYIVTPDMQKISLPRSHVEHRDGTISGIYLKPLKSRDVELVCEGRVKVDEKEGLQVKVKKILSVKNAN